MASPSVAPRRHFGELSGRRVESHAGARPVDGTSHILLGATGAHLVVAGVDEHVHGSSSRRRDGLLLGKLPIICISGPRRVLGDDSSGMLFS